MALPGRLHVDGPAGPKPRPAFWRLLLPTLWLLNPHSDREAFFQSEVPHFVLDVVYSNHPAGLTVPVELSYVHSSLYV
jgi:hypothetical protein